MYTKGLFSREEKENNIDTKEPSRLVYRFGFLRGRVGVSIYEKLGFPKPGSPFLEEDCLASSCVFPLCVTIATS